MRTLRTSTLVGAIVAVVLLLLGGTVAVVSRSGPDLPTSATMNVYMDGWSMSNIVPSSLKASNDSLSSGAALNWRPATLDDIAQLHNEAPGLLTNVAARMISSDAHLKCTTTGCSDSHGAIPDEWFVDATKIPVLGREYKAYGIRSTLWVSEAAQSRTTLYLHYGVGSTYLLSGFVNSHVDPLARTGSDGYSSNRWIISSAFGQLFAPQPWWLSSTTAYQPLSPQPTVGTSGGVLDTLGTGTVFTGGLGVPDLRASGLNATQLTYMSSPTTGCGAGVLCVPGSASGLHTSVRSTSQSLACSLDGHQAALVTGVEAAWTYHFSAPTTQYQGLGGGSTALLSGTHTLYSHLVYFTSGDIPQLLSVDGTTSTSGWASAGVSDILKSAPGPLGVGWQSC